MPAPEFPGHAGPEPDRHPDPRPGHDRLGQGQERIPGDRRVLQLRGRGHARRRGDRPLRRPAPAGGLRHRVLATRGGQAQADARREGARPPGRHRHRRRLRDRQGDRPPARRGRARTSSARTSTRPRPRRPPRRSPTDYGLGIGVAGTGLSNCGPAIGLGVNITDRASIRRLLDDVAMAYGGFDSICVTAGIFVPSDTTGHIPDDKWAVTFGDQRHRELPGRRRGRRRPGGSRGCAGVSF